eukprot:GEMP01048374.1.p1 GENE.GEMP01048374.1~~GEMP01048374.1.p1  ORF type:complete len:248 (+),score=66.00 GEMP01048374.1:164-907(+)
MRRQQVSTKFDEKGRGDEQDIDSLRRIFKEERARCLQYRDEKAEMLKQIEALEKKQKEQQTEIDATKERERILENRFFGIRKLNRTILDFERTPRLLGQKHQPFTNKQKKSKPLVSPAATKSTTWPGAAAASSTANAAERQRERPHLVENEPREEPRGVPGQQGNTVPESSSSPSTKKKVNLTGSAIVGANVIKSKAQATVKIPKNTHVEWSPKLAQDLRATWKVKRQKKKHKVSDLLWRAFFDLQR